MNRRRFASLAQWALARRRLNSRHMQTRMQQWVHAPRTLAATDDYAHAVDEVKKRMLAPEGRNFEVA